MGIVSVSCFIPASFLMDAGTDRTFQVELATMDTSRYDTENTSRHHLDRTHVDEYLKEMKLSEPEEDFEDRLRLYTI